MKNKSVKRIMITLLAVFVLSVIVFCFMASSAQSVVYLSDSGSDSNSGTTADAPVKTMACAYKKIGGNGTVVVCGEYSITLAADGELPTGTGTVTLTSVYGGVDYRAKGALLNIGTNLFIGSDMHINNINMHHISSPKIFCLGHNVKLGEGISSSYTAKPAAVFGGTNLQKDGVTVRSAQYFGFTLEVCSGEWLYVTGGSYREKEDAIIGVIGDAKLIINGGSFIGAGKDDDDREVVSGIAGSGLFGDLYMEINGGSFNSSVFGAAFCGMNGSRRIPGHLGDIHISITGGSFKGTQLSAVQEKTNFVEGDFYLDINGASFSSSLEKISAEGVDGTSYVTAPASLDSYLEHFGGNIYVSASGNDTASGSRSAPVRTLSAAAKLLSNGGRIIILDGVMSSDENLAEIEKDIIITSKTSLEDYTKAASLTVSGRLGLSADTRIEHLNIIASEGAEICAQGHDLTLGCTASVYDPDKDALEGGDVTVTGELSVSGGDSADAHTISINSGSYHTVRGGTSDKGTAVVVNGGKISGNIYGAGGSKTDGSASVLVGGGLVLGNIYGSEGGCASVSGVCITGGRVCSVEIGAVLTGTADGEFSIGLYGGSFGSSPSVVTSGAALVSASAAGGYESIVSEIKYRPLTVFVSDGGTGDGSTPNTPVGSFAEATKKVTGNGARVVVMDDVCISGGTSTQAKGAFEVTSFGGGCDFGVAKDAKLVMSSNIALYSEVTFDHIEFFAAENRTAVLANCNKVEFGEHVECTVFEGRGVEYPLSVYGGISSTGAGYTGIGSTDVTIRSGTYYKVFGGNTRSTGGVDTARTITGEINLNIYGGLFLNTVCLNGMNDLKGDANLNIYGGTFKCPVFGASNNSPDINAGNGKIDGDITINIYGGSFCGNIDASKDNKYVFNGKYTLNVYGGDLSRVTTIRGTDKMAGGSCSSSIYSDKDLAFDKTLSGEIEFTNPIGSYADPSVQYDTETGYYYYTYSGLYGSDQAIYITRAANLCDIGCSDPILIWTSAMQADGRGSELKSIWAPQLNFIDGRWYIYATCAESESDSAKRLPYVWVGGEDPVGSFSYHGPIDNYDTQVAIYLSPRLIEYGGKRYICNGGFYRESDRTGHQQSLFITELATPTSFKGDPVVIARPSKYYEDYKILEGPIGLVSPGGQLYMCYAAGHTRGQEYCTGIMKFKGSATDSLANASLWEKMDEPLHFVDYESRVYSPGAMMFTTSPDGTQIWAVYHAKKYTYTAYTMRRMYMQPLTWDNDFPVIEDPRPVDTVFTIPINSRTVNSRVSDFDNAYSIDTLFVRQGASGDGKSISSPLGKITDAYYRLPEDGGVIVIIGDFVMEGNYTEPVHSGRITITQSWGGVDLSEGGAFGTGGTPRSFTLSGDTKFEYMRFETSGSAALMIVARYNSIEIGRGVVCTGFAGTEAAKSLAIFGGHNRTIVNSGTGAGDADITVRSGSGIFIASQNRYVTDTSTRSASIKIYGGEIGKIYGGCINGGIGNNVLMTVYGGSFKNLIDLGYGVSGNVTLTVEGGDFSSCPSIVGKEGAARALVCAGLERVVSPILSEFDSVSLLCETVYLKQGADGDGSSPDTPMGKLTAAYAKLGRNGGTIVIMGEFAMEGDFVAPITEGTVRITGVYGGVDYREGGALSTGGTGRRIDINGPTIFENINLSTKQGSYLFLVANYNPVEIGEGVNCTGFTGSSVNNSLSILGGHNSSAKQLRDTGADAEITVRSGSGILIAGLDRYIGTNHQRSAVINICGGEVVTLYGGNINGGTGKDVQINIHGGTVKGAFSCAYGIAGDVTLNITGGDFSSAKSITGNYKLDCVANIADGVKAGVLSKTSGFINLRTPGDADLDSSLTNKDLTLIIRYLSGWKLDVSSLICDVNGDKKINNRDAIALIWKLS